MELYNPEVKEEFLSQYQGRTRDVYRNIFKKTKQEEERLQKDLYDFDLDDIFRVMRNLNPQTLNSAETQGRVISQYIAWAIDRELRYSNINPMIGLEPDFYKKTLQNVKLYYREDEIEVLENRLNNYQDKVIVRLIFEGVLGDRCSELINLHKNSIKENNTLYLQDDKKGSRYIQVSDRCMNFIWGALGETEYLNRNGTVDNPRRATSELMEGDYVIRNTKTNTKSEQATTAVIFRRLAMIRDVFEDYHTLTPKKIEDSGMLAMARDLYKRDGELGSKQLLEIAKRYNRTKMINGYLQPQQELRKIVNLENIKLLYPEIFE